MTSAVPAALAPSLDRPRPSVRSCLQPQPADVGRHRPSKPERSFNADDHLRAVRAYLNAFENDRIDPYKINDFGKTIATELEAFDASFSARTSAGDPIILALQRDTVALVRAVSSDEDGRYDRIRTNWLGRLDGDTLVRETKPETARARRRHRLEHERIGGELKIDLPHQPQELEELFAALRRIVGLKGLPSAEPMVAFS